MKRRMKPDDVARIYVREERDQDGFQIKYINDFIGKAGSAWSVDLLLKCIAIFCIAQDVQWSFQNVCKIVRAWLVYSIYLQSSMITRIHFLSQWLLFDSFS